MDWEPKKATLLIRILSVKRPRRRAKVRPVGDSIDGPGARSR